MARLIVQIGTNNWQRNGEFAPGSGILHEAHHRAFAELDDTVAWSMYPSRTQRFFETDVRVFELDHDIPICESVSPVSSYRWHAMSDAEFDAYRDRLGRAVEQMIDDLEARHGEPVSLAIAHHTFMNPLVMADVNRRRIAAGRPRVPVLCFVHGTALKMFAAESSGAYPQEFPERFLPLVRREGIFGADAVVDWCAAISTQQVAAFAEIFPEFDRERIVLSPNGYNHDAFSPVVRPADAARWRRGVLPTFVTAPYDGSAELPTPLPGNHRRLVAFCGKFADWKRLDVVLAAARIWEAERGDEIATVIVGSGPPEAQRHYQDMAREQLGLKHVAFVGAQRQQDLAVLFTAADVAVFPSANEPFGLVFIEAMACGTPVIGADSGGPRDFVVDEVGHLIEESENHELLAARLAAATCRALDDEWKRSKGPVAAAYARDNFSVQAQVTNLLSEIGLGERVATPV